MKAIILWFAKKIGVKKLVSWLEENGWSRPSEKGQVTGDIRRILDGVTDGMKGGKEDGDEGPDIRGQQEVQEAAKPAREKKRGSFRPRKGAGPRR